MKVINNILPLQYNPGALGYVYMGIKALGLGHGWPGSAESGLQGLGCRTKSCCVDIRAQARAHALGHCEDSSQTWVSTQPFFSPGTQAQGTWISWHGLAAVFLYSGRHTLRHPSVPQDGVSFILGTPQNATHHTRQISLARQVGFKGSWTVCSFLASQQSPKRVTNITNCCTDDPFVLIVLDSHGPHFNTALWEKCSVEDVCNS